MSTTSWRWLLLAAMWVLWPTSVFLWARNGRGRTRPPVLRPAIFALLVTVAAGILSTGGVSAIHHRSAVDRLFLTVWIVAPPLLLLAVTVRRHRIHREPR